MSLFLFDYCPRYPKFNFIDELNFACTSPCLAFPSCDLILELQRNLLMDIMTLCRVYQKGLIKIEKINNLLYVYQLPLNIQNLNVFVLQIRIIHYLVLKILYVFLKFLQI